MEELIRKYNLLQKAIYRLNNNSEYVDDIDLLKNTEEEFGCELYDFLLDYQVKEGCSEV